MNVARYTKTRTVTYAVAAIGITVALTGCSSTKHAGGGGAASTSLAQLSLAQLGGSLPSAVPTIDAGENSICSALFGTAAAVSSEFAQYKLGTPAIDGGEVTGGNPGEIDCVYTNVAVTNVNDSIDFELVTNGIVSSVSTLNIYVAQNGPVYLSIRAPDDTPFTAANKTWAQKLVARLTP